MPGTLGLSSSQEANDFVTGFMVDAAASNRSLSDDEPDVEVDVAATQVLQEEEEEEERVMGDDKPQPQQEDKKAEAEAPVSSQESEGEALSAEERFVRAFGTVWELLEKRGWQIAHGRDTMFCAMPGVQFFNFRPNINVFDSKEKACWKFIAQSREQHDSKDDSKDDEAVVWDTLWPIAEKHFGWFTMQCGPETMFIKPGTRFEDFKPNETIFQTKKGAVLKCLAAEVGKIELGDSVEGHQVIAFEAEKPKPKPKPKPVAAKPDVDHTPVHNSSFSLKTPSPKVPKKLTTPASSKSKYITPPTKRSIAAASSTSSSSKKKLSSSSASKKKKLKPTGKSKKAKAIAALRTTPEKDPNAFTFQGPEFRVSFGLVYQRLQDIGWRHRSGQFEYDYFSPTYNKDTAVLNVDYFHSQAEFENFLRSGGLWHKIEAELRAEHDEYVAELRAEAEEKHRKQQAQAAKRKKQVAKMSSAVTSPEQTETARPAVKKAKTVAKKPSASAAKKTVVVGGSSKWANEISSFRQEAENAHCAITIGKVTAKLVARGWTYRPGRFEYDYFKPGITNKKTARLNEDYFESVADLEMHLKMTGLWDRIAREIEDDHFAEQEKMAIQMSQEEDRSRSEKKAAPVAAIARDAEEETKESEAPSSSQSQSEPLSQSQPQASATPPRHPHLKRKASPPPHASLSSPSVKKPRSPGINKRDVQALTNEIWANSHEFDFDE